MLFTMVILVSAEKADEVGYTCYLSIKGVTQPDPMVYPLSFLTRILLQ